jgi:hypothetical protein
MGWSGNIWSAEGCVSTTMGKKQSRAYIQIRHPQNRQDIYPIFPAEKEELSM